MESAFGWTLLSRDALRRAETQLRDDVDGVRDEIGFLSLHQAYADRFFPGTSVLHTRLRYVLFVPWLYEKVANLPDRQRIMSAVERCEIDLTRRLKDAGESGVIGIRNYPKPTAQPPSMTYWSALGTWRILQSLPNGTIPSRQSVHRAIARTPTRQLLHDDDKQLLVEDHSLFCALPRPPAAWHDQTQRLDFKITPHEKQFLRNCFLSVTKPGHDKSLSLLARLVESRTEITGELELWSGELIATADRDDQEALLRARRAAALAAIGRGIYAALVERMRAEHDGLATENVHRANLASVVEMYATDSLALDIDAIAFDAPSVPHGILEVIRATQVWLQKRTRDTFDLLDIYEQAEVKRKGRRARLSKTLAGREKRAEWKIKDAAAAEPLHYRWKQVRQLLLDLQGAP